MMGVKDYLLDSFALLRTSLFCLILKANFLLIFLLLEYVLFELFIMDKYINQYFPFLHLFVPFPQVLLHLVILLSKVMCTHVLYCWSLFYNFFLCSVIIQINYKFIFADILNRSTQHVIDSNEFRFWFFDFRCGKCY